jgi:hypothetical protein
MPEKHDRERHAQADYLLDRVLARYAGEPLAGLENRTLRRLRAQQAAAVQRFFSWRSLVPYIAAAAAAGATVSVSLAIGIHIGQHRANVAWQQRIANCSPSNAVGRAGAVNVPPTSAVTAANTGSRIRRAHTGAAAVEPSGRHAAQFPSPVPLTAQESALARLASTGDPALLSSLAHATHPIEIVPPDNSASESRPRW